MGEMANIWFLAVSLFGDEAFSWLNKENEGLDGKTPFSLIELGKQEIVKELLEDIALGHPS